jgi:hypothetical protein
VNQIQFENSGVRNLLSIPPQNFSYSKYSGAGGIVALAGSKLEANRVLSSIHALNVSCLVAVSCDTDVRNVHFDG